MYYDLAVVLAGASTQYYDSEEVLSDRMHAHVCFVGECCLQIPQPGNCFPRRPLEPLQCGHIRDAESIALNWLRQVRGNMRTDRVAFQGRKEQKQGMWSLGSFGGLIVRGRGTMCRAR